MTCAYRKSNPTFRRLRLQDLPLILLTHVWIWMSRFCFSLMALFPLLFSLARSFFAPRLELMAEILAPRQQLAILNRTANRLSLRFQDRLFWVALAKCWKERPGYLNPRGRWPASPLSAGSMKPARLICSRILIDGRSSRKNRLGAIRLILLNRPNGPSRNDGGILRRFVCPKE